MESAGLPVRRVMPHRGSPLVSVVVPTYNRPALLERAVGSILRQTYRRIEVIVVDDHPSNSGRSIIGKFADDRIRYLEDGGNKGACAARNTGIAAAVGGFVTFLDDDDAYERDKIVEQLKAIKGFDAVVCGYSVVRGGVGQRFRRDVVSLGDLRHGNVLGGGTSSLMVRAAVIRENLFDENLPCNQDWDLLVRLARRHRIRYISDPLVIYDNRDHARISNERRNMTVEEIEHRMLAIRKHREFLGPFWFRFRASAMLLSYFRYREQKISWLVYVLRNYGAIPVFFYFVSRAYIVARSGSRQRG